MEARIDNYHTWIVETEPAKLKSLFEGLLLEAGFGILNFIEHYFEPQGWTGLWLLSESHFAIHTFPEQEKTYIELSSCNLEMYNAFLAQIEAYKKQETLTT